MQDVTKLKENVLKIFILILNSKKAQLGGVWGFIVMGMVGLLVSSLIGVYIVIPILQNASATVTGTAGTILQHTPTMVALGIFMLSVLLIGVGGFNIYQERKK